MNEFEKSLTENLHSLGFRPVTLTNQTKKHNLAMATVGAVGAVSILGATAFLSNRIAYEVLSNQKADHALG